MRRQSTIEKLAKTYGFQLKRCNRHLVWAHKVSQHIVVTPMTPSDQGSIRMIEKRFRQVSMFP